MAQSWHDLLFAHWRVDPAILRLHIPKRLEIDLFQGQAWLGIVPFRMSKVRFRGTPAMPRLSAFPELNVRTYVVADGKPGVWFFSLDAANALAVATARAWFHLPYFRAQMKCREGDAWINYSSRRTHKNAPSAILHAKYRPMDKKFLARPGTLEHFLTERYCLYAASARQRIYRGEIHHPPWPLQLAEAEFGQNTMADAAGVALPRQRPLLLFSRRQDVIVWPPRRID